jgi:exodeoxyribonuclease-3
MAALALRPSMVPMAPAPNRLRLATWNVNSIRTRLAAMQRFLERTRPDVVCLQETKTAELSAAADAAFRAAGYSVANVGNGGYNGVAVAARFPLSQVVASGDFGDEHLDREPRVLSCLVAATEPLRVVSVYVPHGRTVDHWHYAYKLSFLDALTDRIAGWLAQGDHVVVAGDMNVAPTNSDVFHPDAFRGSTHVTPPERDALSRLLDSGLIDADVARWGAHARRFTWWNYGIGYARNLGMRLDMIATDRALAERLDTTWIDHLERDVRPSSDHAALLADFRPSAGRNDTLADPR